MSKQTFSTNLTPDIKIGQVLGNLQIKGWESPEVVINTEDDEMEIQAQEDSIEIAACEADCLIRLPQGAAVHIGTVEGDFNVKFLEDGLSVGNVMGSLELRDIANAQIDTVDGALSGRRISGELRANAVHGEVELRSIQGGCWLNEVGGNIDLRDVEGEIHVKVRGNARLRLSNLTGSQYDIQADGNMHCHVPEDASLQLHLASESSSIRVKLPDGTKNYHQPDVDLTLDGGSATMNLSANGTLSLYSQPADWSDAEGDTNIRFGPDFSQKIASEVESQIQSQMEAVTRQMTEQMARISETMSKVGLSEAEQQRIIERSREATERATARSQEKLRRSQEKLERKLEAAQRRQEARAQGQGRRRWGFEWPTPPTPPTPPAPPAPPAAVVSDEERLMILRMLEQKKISLEEADRLLAALEGKE